jgi:hypothetical protein
MDDDLAELAKLAEPQEQVETHPVSDLKEDALASTSYGSPERNLIR